MHPASSENKPNELNIQSENNTFTSSPNYEEEDKTYAYAAELINSCILPLVMKSTIEMGLLQVIHDEADGTGLFPAEIAARLPTENPDAPLMVDRMLRLLATYSVVSCITVPTADGGVERKYGPTAVTKCFIPDLDGVPLASLLNLLTDNVFLQSWSKLKEAVIQGGVPFDKVHGMSTFEYLGVDPRFNEIFNKAMYDHSTYIIKKILERYEGFQNIHNLVDVGGGLGHTLHVITSQYPSIKGINFDLPHVIEHAPSFPGVEHVIGDMFQSVPKGDAIFIKSIFHSWSDDECLTLLKNCYEALPFNGKVIVVETNVTDMPETTSLARAITQFDILMMTQHSGKERTRREFETLAKVAGFAGVKHICCVAIFSVMEFHK